MHKLIASVLPEGHCPSLLGLTPIDADTQELLDLKIAKAMFEVSRSTDMDTHFDPAIHTLEAIAQGLPGHVPVACRECEDTDLPTDRYFRNAWEWSD